MTEDRRVRGDALLGEGVAEGTIDFRLDTVGEEAALEVGVTRSVLMAVGGVFRTGVLLALTAVGALLTGVLLGRVAEGGLVVDVAVLALLVAAVEVRARMESYLAIKNHAPHKFCVGLFSWGDFD